MKQTLVASAKRKSKVISLLVRITDRDSTIKINDDTAKTFNLNWLSRTDTLPGVFRELSTRRDSLVTHIRF